MREPSSETYLELGRGVYSAERAAALAGVPVSTLHYWARKELYRPSISPEPRVRFWSWMDLLALRMIDWLRHEGPQGLKPRVPISRIRKALGELDQLGIPPEAFHEVIMVTRDGSLFIRSADNSVSALPGRQQAWTTMLEVVRPYKTGPDLLEPRPLLRIIPGKLHGEPHLLDTRITSAAVYALYQAGYDIPAIREMYPEVIPAALHEAIDLEHTLESPAA